MRTVFRNLVTKVPTWILMGKHRKAESPAVHIGTLIGGEKPLAWGVREE